MKSTVIRNIRKEDPEYPGRMKPLKGMPKSIYVIGPVPSDSTPSVAVVGARMCSGYGHDTAYAIGEFLGRHGIQVISGMAVGIDGYAQQGALDAGGSTCAVLASGPDVCYPRTNADLYDRILLKGSIISEHEPGTLPLAPYFPSRNRIISALADIVVIVEAKERSGSLITADFALDQGKTVYAVPGRICDELSSGCNRLIAQGASILTSADCLLFELEQTAAVHRSFSAWIQTDEKLPYEQPLPKQIETLSEAARSILSLFSGEDSMTPDMAAAKLKIPVSEASGSLIELCLMGKAEEIGRSHFRILSK